MPDALTFARQLQDECLGVRVGRLHRIVSRHYEQALRPIGRSLSQVGILGGLTLIGDPVAPSYLADQLAVERSTMSRNLALMRGRDLIAPAATSPAGRTQTITITAAGIRALAHAREAWRWRSGPSSSDSAPTPRRRSTDGSSGSADAAATDTTARANVITISRRSWARGVGA